MKKMGEGRTAGREGRKGVEKRLVPVTSGVTGRNGRFFLPL